MWIKYKASMRRCQTKVPFATIHQRGTLNFSISFIKEAQIQSYNKIKIYIDNENQKLGLIFYHEEKKDPYDTDVRMWEHRANNTKACFIKELFELCPWILEKITENNNSSRRFTLQKTTHNDETMWIIDFNQ